MVKRGIKHSERIMGDRQQSCNAHKDDLVLVPKVEKRAGWARRARALVHLSMEGLAPFPRYTSLHVDPDRTHWQHSSPCLAH